MNKRAIVVEYVRDDWDQPVHLAPPVLKIVQKDRDIVIGIRPSIPARAGAEQDDTIQPGAVQLFQRHTEANEHGFGGDIDRHAEPPAVLSGRCLIARGPVERTMDGRRRSAYSGA
jgi:hypothetical protein